MENEGRISQIATLEVSAIAVEAERTSGRPLLIFGQGPLIDPESRIKAQDAETAPGSETMNFWGDTLAEAGAILYHSGVTSEIIIMGGKTGGKTPENKDYAAEADILEEKLVALGVPHEKITKERRSGNTLENLLYFTEEVLENRPDLMQAGMDVLGAHGHNPRIRILMELYGLPYVDSFVADEVIRTALLQDHDLYRYELLDIDKRLDVNQQVRTPHSERDRLANPTYYDDKLGTEQKSYLRRAQEETAFTRMLLEIPEYWITYVGRITDDVHLRKVLGNVEAVFPGYLDQQGLGKEDIFADKHKEAAYLAKVRETLTPIQRIIPHLDILIEEYEEQGWTAALQQKLERFVEARQAQ